ncbi:silent information regulator protein Sir2 [Streptomyces sp. 8K308]|uniref:polysaccharide lyase family 8 super-sandwich domain-containing protein n=1 Tax=Streptomyces sp. 8K308 TaxID=2530388 RepID=UPI00104628D2|nr:polysaccharide lyase family 8 super-sandwich domain-containing protein [Streptomyces sp. 8K308]TDC27052.1 silent information regulator protein Sir2 [Streptomyces sp. 8K308]
MPGLDTVRTRLCRELLAAEPPDVTRLDRLADTLKDDGTWPDVDYTAPEGVEWPALAHVSRARSMAGSTAHHGQALRALDGWRQLGIRAANWWYNEIGVPQNVGDALLLLRDQLDAEQREQWGDWLGNSAGPVEMTGQNIIWRAGVELRRAVLVEDTDLLAAAVARMASVLRPTRDEGIQDDLSFHHHGPLPYAGGYGASLVTTVVPWVQAVHGTPWAFDEPKVRLLVDYLLDGQQWALHGDGYDFTLMGREVSRATAHRAGGPLREALRRLLTTDPPRSAELAALERRLARLAAGGRAEGGPVGCRYYPRSDYLAHRGPGWSVSVRMSSTRTIPSESINGENLRGRHLADGVATIRVGDASDDGYRAVLPLWDWACLPGTTAEQPPDPAALLPRPGDRRGASDDVAGWTDGRLGIALMRLAGTDRVDDGWKAWFCFDDMVIALGADITAPSAEHRVVTTLDQRLATGPVTTGAGFTHQGRIGYIPLTAHPGVFSHTRPRTGRWSDITRDGEATPLTADVFHIGVDHGPAPRGAAYAWLVLPDTDAETTSRRATRPGVTVLANTATLQAVRCHRTGITLTARHDATGMTLGTTP